MGWADMHTALVTGATGFLGRHVVAELLAQDVRVRAICRTPAAAADLAARGVALVEGDLTDDGACARAFDPAPEVVFHTAADTNNWTPRNAAQARTNVDATRTLAALAERHGSVFVHTSSIAAFSHLVPGTLREDTPQRGGESWVNYERTKWQGEQCVREAQARGLRAIVCHPAHIFGPGDTRNWSRLIALIDQDRLPGAPPGSGDFADAREIARAQVRAWQGGHVGGRYLMGGEHATFLDLVQRIARLLGRRVPVRATPAPLLKGYARVLDGISRLTKREPEVTPEAAVFACHHLRVDHERAVRELDYRVTPLDRLLADTVDWMRSAGMLSRHE